MTDAGVAVESIVVAALAAAGTVAIACGCDATGVGFAGTLATGDDLNVDGSPAPTGAAVGTAAAVDPLIGVARGTVDVSNCPDLEAVAAGV